MGRGAFEPSVWPGRRQQGSNPQQKGPYRFCQGEFAIHFATNALHVRKSEESKKLLGSPCMQRTGVILQNSHCNVFLRAISILSRVTRLLVATFDTDMKHRALLVAICCQRAGSGGPNRDIRVLEDLRLKVAGDRRWLHSGSSEGLTGLESLRSFYNERIRCTVEQECDDISSIVSSSRSE
ncbi:hypothetical protein PoB_003604300 [Plakobranchus ocellatus]|uniref:Uncharacterized protein n=1 Tax=Plakobranchus ocellatus TaxID=259542 RepID=A0AAV4ASJ5_9GAST|nr:hypothetical protein PoB_003604300 [Plakobranchus ocellatus]